MMEKNIWKKNDRQEISILDIIYKIIKNWKIIICFAAIGVLALGGYGFYRNHKNSVQGHSQSEAQMLTVKEQEEVKYAQALQDLLDEQDTYMAETLLLKVNAYQEDRTVLQYEITGQDGSNAIQILEQCVAYIQNGSAVTDILTQADMKWNLSAQSLQELIEVTKSESSYDIFNDSPNRYFYVILIGEDQEMAETLADEMEKALDAYGKSKFTETQQKLILLSRQNSVVYDVNLEQKKSTLLSARNDQANALESLKSKFTAGQLAAFGQGFDEMMLSETGKGADSLGYVKYIAVGLLMGIFVGCCWFAGCYLLTDKIKSATDMEINYNLPIFGVIKTRCRNDTGNQKEKSEIFTRLLFLCRKKDLKNILFVSGHELFKWEENNKIQKDLESHGIRVSFVENVLEQANAYKQLETTDAVVVLAEAEKTAYSLLDKMLAFLQENEVLILGSIVIE